MDIENEASLARSWLSIVKCHHLTADLVTRSTASMKHILHFEPLSQPFLIPEKSAVQAAVPLWMRVAVVLHKLGSCGEYCYVCVSVPSLGKRWASAGRQQQSHAGIRCIYATVTSFFARTWFNIQGFLETRVQFQKPSVQVSEIGIWWTNTNIVSVRKPDHKQDTYSVFCVQQLLNEVQLKKKIDFHYFACNVPCFFLKASASQH